MSEKLTAVDVVDILEVTNGGKSDTSITVATTGTAYSKSFPLPFTASFGFSLQFSTGGAVAVTVELEQSNDLPATEEAADTGWAVPIDADGASQGGIIDADSENYMVVNFAPVVSKYARLKLTGTGSNAADTKLILAQMNFVQRRR